MPQCIYRCRSYADSAGEGNFHQLYNRRLLIRLIGVRFSHLVHGNYQIDMFDDTEQRIQLYQAIDKVNRSYGKRTVCRAVAMGH